MEILFLSVGCAVLEEELPLFPLLGHVQHIVLLVHGAAGLYPGV